MRNFQQEKERVESGPIQFGDDWPGLFMRGDDAFGHSLNIRTVWQHLKERYEKENMPIDLYLALKGLAGVSDDIQKEVVVGGNIVTESMSTDVDATMRQRGTT